MAGKRLYGHGSGEHQRIGPPSDELTDSPQDEPTGVVPSQHSDRPPPLSTSTHGTSTPSSRGPSTPTGRSTRGQTSRETNTPTGRGTRGLSIRETSTPTGRRTSTPTGRGTGSPTIRETNTPTGRGTGGKTSRETNTPTGRGTGRPTIRETNTPTGRRTSTPAGRKHSNLTSTQKTGHNSIQSGDVGRTYTSGRHTELKGNIINGPVMIGSPSRPGAATGVLAKEEMENLVRKIDWDLLSSQLSAVDQDQYRSDMSPFDFNNPNIFWITRNIDFTKWESADTPRALFLSASDGHGTTEFCWHTIDLAKKESNCTVLYFFCSSAKQPRCSAILIHTLLRQVVGGSSDGNSNSIAAVFLNALIRGHIQRSSDIRDDDPLDETVREILEAPDDELLGALAEAIKEAGIQEFSIIADGLDEHTASRLFGVLRKATPKSTFLLASQHPLERTSYGMTYIEYDKERKECLRFLRYDDTRYDKISKEHHGSLQWFWTHPQYLGWSASTTSSLLYIEGKPGSGKSTLAKYFKENLDETEPDGSPRTVAHYFYTFRGTQLEPTHVNMLRSLLCSILEQDESTFFHFQQEFRNFRGSNLSQWPYDSLKTVLLSFADHPTAKPLYLIIDAMDESEEDDRRSIIQLLCRLCSKENPCNIKVFLASRPLAELQHRIEDSHHVIRMQDVNKDDICRFADDFLDKDLKLKGKILCETRNYIAENAQGVFVWVALIRNELLRYAETGCRGSEILRQLKALPRELEALYERIFSRLENGHLRDTQDGILLFRFIFFALRPLTVEELRDALAVPDAHNPCYEDFEQDKIDAIGRRIEHCGGGFLEIKANETVQFMHQTVREFISLAVPRAKNLRFEIRDEPVNRTITATLCRYLILLSSSPAMRNRFSQIEDWSPDEYRAYAEYLNEWPLFDYALLSIKGYRDRRGQDESVPDVITATVQQLTKNQATYFLGSFVAFHTGGNDSHPTQVDKYQATSQDVEFRTLNAAAEPLLPHAARAVLTCTQNDGYTEGKTPLIISAQKGLPAATVLFLNHPDQIVDVNATDDIGRTALHYAAQNSDEIIVGILIERGANRQIEDSNGVLALELAVDSTPSVSEDIRFEVLLLVKEVKRLLAVLRREVGRRGLRLEELEELVLEEEEEAELEEEAQLERLDELREALEERDDCPLIIHLLL